MVDSGGRFNQKERARVKGGVRSTKSCQNSAKMTIDGDPNWGEKITKEVSRCRSDRLCAGWSGGEVGGVGGK